MGDSFDHDLSLGGADRQSGDGTVTFPGIPEYPSLRIGLAG